MEKTELTKLVKELLRNNEDYRDNYESLASNLWGELLSKKGYDMKLLPSIDFLSFISSGKLPKFDSITRISRMIQMKDPETFGGKRRLNKFKQQKAKKDLGYDN